MEAIAAETGGGTGAVVGLIAAAVTATRVRSPRVSRAVRPPRRLVRNARIAAPGVVVVVVTGIAARVVVVVAVVVASAAVVASASRLGPWWS